MKPLCAAALLLLLAGCAGQPVAPPPPPPVKLPVAPPEITSRTEEGFHDLLLGIQKTSSDAAGNLTLLAAGTHKGARVAITIKIHGGMRPFDLTGKAGFSGIDKTGIRLLSAGPESDRFLQVLAALYGVKNAKGKMKKEAVFTCAALQGDPAKVQTELIKWKLFHNGDEKDYCELYLNVNIPRGEVEIREKDEEYRKAIIEMLIGVG